MTGSSSRGYAVVASSKVRLISFIDKTRLWYLVAVRLDLTAVVIPLIHSLLSRSVKTAWYARVCTCTLESGVCLGSRLSVANSSLVWSIVSDTLILLSLMYTRFPGVGLRISKCVVGRAGLFHQICIHIILCIMYTIDAKFWQKLWKLQNFTTMGGILYGWKE